LSKGIKFWEGEVTEEWQVPGDCGEKA